MNTWTYIAISVVVAAFIGGVTNHLAIRMLFRPRQPIYIFRRKLLFTPGLIPKRKDEISKSLGEVVGDYLVTSSGLSEMISKSEFRTNLEATMRRFVERWSEEEITLEQLLLRSWSNEQVEGIKKRSYKWIHAGLVRGGEWLFIEKGLLARPIGELVPRSLLDNKEIWIDRAVDYVVDVLRKELLSPGGEQLLRRLSVRFLDQAGGVWGTLAGIFINEDKMVQKVRDVAYKQVNSNAVRSAIQTFIVNQWDKAQHMTIAELLAVYADLNDTTRGVLEGMDEMKSSSTPERQFVMDMVDRLMEKGLSAEGLFSVQLNKLVLLNRDWLLQKTPEMSEMAVKFFRANMERVVSAIDLPSIVQREVEKFPVERLENLLLSISGKEFRAITWLGVFLGGIIGLIQSAILRFLL